MTMSGHKFRRYGKGDRPSARDMNARAEAIEKFDRSQPINSVVDATGIITKRDRAGGGTATLKKARIISTLQREDLIADIDARPYYEIELLGDEIEYWDQYAPYYEVGTKVKYPLTGESKVYICTVFIPGNLVPSLPPTATSHWDEDGYVPAGVWGYTEDLLATAPWFQPDEIVHVVRYEHPDETRWEYWILETVFKIEHGTGATKQASLYWLQEDDDGNTIARICSVYR